MHHQSALQSCSLTGFYMSRLHYFHVVFSSENNWGREDPQSRMRFADQNQVSPTQAVTETYVSLRCSTFHSIRAGAKRIEMSRGEPLILSPFICGRPGLVDLLLHHGWVSSLGPTNSVGSMQYQIAHDAMIQQLRHCRLSKWVFGLRYWRGRPVLAWPVFIS